MFLYQWLELEKTEEHEMVQNGSTTQSCKDALHPLSIYHSVRLSFAYVRFVHMLCLRHIK